MPIKRFSTYLQRQNKLNDEVNKNKIIGDEKLVQDEYDKFRKTMLNFAPEIIDEYLIHLEGK